MQSSSELDSDSGGDATSSSSESGNEQKGKTSCRDAADVNDDSDGSNDSGGDAQLGSKSRLSQPGKKARNDAAQDINDDSDANNDSGGDAQLGLSQPGKKGANDAAKDINGDSDANNDSGGDAQLGLSQPGKKARNDAPQVPRKRGRPRKHNTERKEKPDHTRAQGSAWEEVFGVPAPPPEGAVGPVQCDISDPSMGGLGFFDDAANISIPDAEYDEVLMQFSSPRVGFFDVGKVLRRHNLYYQVCIKFCASFLSAYFSLHFLCGLFRCVIDA